MQIYVAFAACPKCLSSHALMPGLMIGNAAMHKPFGIESGLRLCSYADTTLFARSFYKPSAPVSHTDNGHSEKPKKKKPKKKQTNTKKKTNCGGDNHNNNSNSHSQGSTTATTIRTTTGNYQTTSPASVSSCSRESSARERSTKTAPDGITSAAEQ